MWPTSNCESRGFRTATRSYAQGVYLKSTWQKLGTSLLLESKLCLVTLFFGEYGSRIHSIVPEFKATSRVLQLASRLPLVTSL